MRADILIVGQGLAGTLLAWECERAGFSFAIADAGDFVASASRVAAGIANPITGRRLVKTWRAETLLPAARAVYREMETAWDVALWRDLRVRRIFVDERERRIFREKTDRGELTPFAGASDEAGFWIENAGRVDVARLIETAAARWREQGRWRTEPVDLKRELERCDLVVDCRGVVAARDPIWSGVPWEFSKGEILALMVEGLEPNVMVNRGQWLLPVANGEAWVGATHEPGIVDASPTAKARTLLEASAATLLEARPFAVTGQFAGVRVNLPDKRPVAGRHASIARLGLVNGLGAKGVTLAPALARQWVNHLTEGVPFDAEVDVARFRSS